MPRAGIDVIRPALARSTRTRVHCGDQKRHTIGERLADVVANTAIASIDQRRDVLIDSTAMPISSHSPTALGCDECDWVQLPAPTALLL